MPWTSPQAARIIFTVLIFAAVLAFIYGAIHTITAFIFAIFFAYLVDPAVTRVQVWTRRRGTAIAVVYAVLLAGLSVFFVLLGSRLVSEATRLAHAFPDFYQKLSSGQIAWTIGGRHGLSHETELRIQQFLIDHRGSILAWASRFGTRLALMLANSWWLLLIPILGVFFLKNGREFAENLVQMFERRHQRIFLRSVLADINLMLAHFIRAQLILAVLSIAFYTPVLLLLRVSYAIVLGVTGGALEFVPVVGPLVAAVLILGVALVTGYKHLLILALLLGVWRIVQDYVNSPRIMGKQVELPPVAALFGILAGAEIAGVVGVYLSIPIMASLRILWRRWQALDNSPDAPQH